MPEVLLTTEHRRMPRNQLIYYLKVKDQNTGQELGRLVDIHTQGLLLITSKAPLMKDGYIMVIEAPKSWATEEAALEIPATPLWVRPSINPTHLEVGFKFENPSEDLQERIERLVDAFRFPDPLRD